MARAAAAAAVHQRAMQTMVQSSRLDSVCLSYTWPHHICAKMASQIFRQKLNELASACIFRSPPSSPVAFAASLFEGRHTLPAVSHSFAKEKRFVRHRRDGVRGPRRKFSIEGPTRRGRSSGPAAAAVAADFAALFAIAFFFVFPPSRSINFESSRCLGRSRVRT